MKRACLCVLSLLLMLGMTACSPTSENEPETDATAEGKGTTSGSDALVVYFSATGNTESVARTLAQLQSAFVVSISLGLLISGVLILVLPLFADAWSLWLAMPLTELITAVYVIRKIIGYTRELSEAHNEAYA